MGNEAVRFRCALIAVCLIATVVFFWQLGTPPLENWDEGIHAEVTLETVQRHSWIDLSYRGAYYTAKPPIKFWLTAPLFILFGPSEFTTRFWSALAGVGTALLLSLWTWQWKKRAWPAFLAAVLFVTLRANFFHGFRTGETDGLMVFFIALALWAYWRSWKQRLLWWVAGASIGLTFMTKPLGGILPLLVIGLDIIVGWRWKELPWKHIGYAAIGVAVVSVPWHAVETLRHGTEFWKSFVGFHVLDRANEVLYKNYVPWWWYWTILKLRAFPYVPFIVLGVLVGVWQWMRKHDPFARLLSLWLATVFVLFTLVQTKFDWYILPMYPAAVLLCVRGIVHLVDSKNVRLQLCYLAAMGWAMYILPSGLVENGTLWKLTPYVYLPTVAHTDWLQRTFVTVVSLLAVLLVSGVVRRYFRSKEIGITVSLVIAYLVVLAVGWQVSYFRHIPEQTSLKPIAVYSTNHFLLQLDAVDADLLHQPALYFYLRRIPGLQLHELQEGASPTTPYVLTRERSLVSLPVPCCAILTAGAYLLLEQPSP